MGPKEVSAYEQRLSLVIVTIGLKIDQGSAVRRTRFITTTIPLRFSFFFPRAGEGRAVRMSSAAAAEAALADGVAGVLPLHEELLVGHHRLIRMGRPAMVDVGLIIGDADHQTGRAHRPLRTVGPSASGPCARWSSMRRACTHKFRLL